MCEVYMRAPDALFGNVRYKDKVAKSRVYSYKFESGARVRRAALPSYGRRRECGAPARRQLERASSSSCSNDIERSRSGDPALVEVLPTRYRRVSVVFIVVLVEEFSVVLA